MTVKSKGVQSFDSQDPLELTQPYQLLKLNGIFQYLVFDN